MNAIGFWLRFAPLAPVLLLQAGWTQATALRLKVPPGERSGEIEGSGPVLPLVVLGESPAAGVGCERQDQALPAQLASILAQRSGRPLRWQALAANGADARTLLRALESHPLPLPDGHLAVVTLGVNDCTGLTPLDRWRALVARLAQVLAERGAARVYFASVPPLHLFTALPQPLRWVLGHRARLLQRELEQHPLRGCDFELLSCEFPPRPEFLAGDGYHPSPAGHRWWAEALAEGIDPRPRPAIPVGPADPAAAAR